MILNSVKPQCTTGSRVRGKLWFRINDLLSFNDLDWSLLTLSLRYCGKEAAKELAVLKNELHEEYYSSAFRNKVLLDLIPKLKGFDLSKISDMNIQSEDAIHRVPQMQMDTIYFPFVEVEEKTKKEIMKWAIFEPHGHSFWQFSSNKFLTNRIGVIIGEYVITWDRCNWNAIVANKSFIFLKS